MFSWITRRFTSNSPESSQDGLLRVLTVAGMIESSPGGYAVADLLDDVSDYMGQPIDIETVRRDLEQLESVGVVAERDGVWTWDVIGIGLNQTVVSRLSGQPVVGDEIHREISSVWSISHSGGEVSHHGDYADKDWAWDVAHQQDDAETTGVCLPKSAGKPTMTAFMAAPSKEAASV